jgi:hypothetical protein
MEMRRPRYGPKPLLPHFAYIIRSSITRKAQRLGGDTVARSGSGAEVYMTNMVGAFVVHIIDSCSSSVSLSVHTIYDHGLDLKAFVKHQPQAPSVLKARCRSGWSSTRWQVFAERFFG